MPFSDATHGPRCRSLSGASPKAKGACAPADPTPFRARLVRRVGIGKSRDGHAGVVDAHHLRIRVGDALDAEVKALRERLDPRLKSDFQLGPGGRGPVFRNSRRQDRAASAPRLRLPATHHAARADSRTRRLGLTGANCHPRPDRRASFSNRERIVSHQLK